MTMLSFFIGFSVFLILVGIVVIFAADDMFAGISLSVIGLVLSIIAIVGYVNKHDDTVDIEPIEIQCDSMYTHTDTVYIHDTIYIKDIK